MKGLDICDYEDYRAEFRTAGHNGSIDSLMSELINLTLSGSLVRLRHARAGEFHVLWLDSKGEIFMSGALIYFDVHNTWSVHT